MRCREDELLRFVLDPEGRVVPDIKRKLPGRGIWLTSTREAVEKSVRQKVFSRGFKQSVLTDPGLADLIAQLLRQAALQNLALANKAGDVVAGYAKVEKALKDGKAYFLVHASDASGDGCRKLDRLASAVSQTAIEDLDRVFGFNSSELSATLGKWNVNHAAVAVGGAGLKFLRSAQRYMSYMGPIPAAGTMADTPEQDKA